MESELRGMACRELVQSQDGTFRLPQQYLLSIIRV